MKTIVVPLDGSALAEQALPYARMLAPLLDATILLLRILPATEQELVHAEQSSVAYYGARMSEHGVIDRPFSETLHLQAESYVDDQVHQLRAAGLPVQGEVQIGSPAELIVEIAHIHQAAMIVMASHGYSGLRRWALGSVTDRVVHTTTTPLFVVRGRANPPEELVQFKRVLVPLDGSDLSQQALVPASELAARAGAELILLRAVNVPIEVYPVFPPMAQAVEQITDTLDYLNEEARKELGILAAELRQKGLLVAPIVENGHAAEVIVDEASAQEADLIIMATHGYGGLRRWALGSIADKVLHASNLPLLLIRSQEAT